MNAKTIKALVFAIFLSLLLTLAACSQKNNDSHGNISTPEFMGQTSDLSEITQAAAVPEEPKPGEVQSIVLAIDSTQITRGTTIDPTVVVRPDNAKDKTYTLTSSNENVLYETSDGWLAASIGTAELTATSANGITGKISISVIVPVESIFFELCENAMHRGNSLVLNPTILPSDATGQDLTYKTDNPSVLTVSDDGIVYAVSAGIATVVCTAPNGVQASCRITVTVPVQSIRISINQSEFNRGTEFEVITEVSPSDATDQTVFLSSSNENIIKPSGDKWIAYGAGTVELIATTRNDVTDRATVRVVVPLESVNFDNAQKAVNRYESVPLNPAFFPSDATNKTLTYTTINPNVATVSDDGTVYAAGVGTTIVTGTASNGVQTSCEITVVVPITSISIKTDRNQYKTGETLGFIVTVYPDDATDKNYSVDITGAGGSRMENDTVLCVSSGSITITASAANGVLGKKEIEIIDLHQLAMEVVRLTNIERANHGLPELSISNSILGSAAMVRAEEIVTSYSHTRPDGRTPITAYEDLGGTFSVGWGENIALGFDSPQAVVNGWMNSEGHKKNILTSSFTHIGVGVAMNNEGRFYWVHLFTG